MGYAGLGREPEGILCRVKCLWKGALDRIQRTWWGVGLTELLKKGGYLAGEGDQLLGRLER